MTMPTSHSKVRRNQHRRTRCLFGGSATRKKEFHAELEWGGEQAPEYSARDQGATGSADKVLELKPEDVEDEETNADEMVGVDTEHAYGKMERERPDHEGLVVLRLFDFQTMPRADGDA